MREIVKDIIKTFKQKKYVFLAELEIWSLANHDEGVRDKTRSLYMNLLQLFSDIIADGIKSGEFKIFNVHIAPFELIREFQPLQETEAFVQKVPFAILNTALRFVYALVVP